MERAGLLEDDLSSLVPGYSAFSTNLSPLVASEGGHENLARRKRRHRRGMHG